LNFYHLPAENSTEEEMRKLRGTTGDIIGDKEDEDEPQV
jgi:hypothetical protein